MSNTAVLPNPQAFAFGLLNANAAADAIDSAFQLESEMKGGNVALMTSDCCGSNNYPSQQ